MKMKKETYEILKDLLSSLTEEQRQQGIEYGERHHRTFPRMHISRCIQWGLFSRAVFEFKPGNAGCSFAMLCYEQGLNDKHIYTALKKAIIELNLL